MEFVNSEMEHLLNDVHFSDEYIECLLKERTTVFSNGFVEINDMVLWNKKNRPIEQLKKVRWDYRMKLMDNVLSKVEFLAYNIIYLDDYFFDLCKNDMVSIGYFCFQYWKDKLKKEFPMYHFFIRFYFQEYNGVIESSVSFHKIRFNESIGASDLLEEPNPAVMFAII